MEIVYLDNAATTKLSEAAKQEMNTAERDLYFNSAALYGASLSVKKAIETANRTVRNRITAGGQGNLIFTSGATEGNNLVLFGKITNPRQHLLIASGEHSSVYSPGVYLKNLGYEVDYVNLLPSGEIDMSSLKRLVKPATALFAFAMVNSDTGCMQNTAEIVKTVKGLNPKVHIHCDAVQAFCKFDFDAAVLGLDSVTVSSHKINGPKGIGALWLRKGVTLKPIMYGGSQQDYRPGTENNAAILGFAAAVANFPTEENYDKINALHARLVGGLPVECKVNGGNTNPYITNIQLPAVMGSTVMNALSEKGICVGLGSACSASASKNRTLLAMGIPEQKTKQVLRVSLGVYNTERDIDYFLSGLRETLAKLR